MAVSKRVMTSMEAREGHPKHGGMLRGDSRGVEMPQQPSIRLLKIQRTCVHDGPGLRTTLFFRGCSLRCLWCQNPEALELQDNEHQDLVLTIPQVVEEVGRDAPFYRVSGGGVTLSGGEPLLQQPTLLLPLLEALREEGIHVAVETSLFAPATTLQQVAPLVDLFLVDTKCGDEEDHRCLTGQGRGLIDQNLRWLVEQGANILFRMVVVPGHNDSPEQLDQVARLVLNSSSRRIELLKYHSMYEDKIARLSLLRPRLGIDPAAADAALKSAVGTLESLGLEVLWEHDQARSKAQFSQRVLRIQEDIRTSPHSLCFEVSKLKTRFYKRNGFSDPAPIHRARRLQYVLQHKTLRVYPGELLVGNFTSQRRGAQVWEEHCGMLLATIMPQIHKQKPVAFQCSTSDKLDFYLNTVPLWLRRSLFAKVYTGSIPVLGNVPFLGKAPVPFLRTLAQTSDVSTGFNNNLASIAHFVVNYPRLLKLGTAGLKAELAEKRQGKPDESQPFYDGVHIALDALEGFADRHAEELDRLARIESDPVRRDELEQLAEVCRVVPRNPARTYHQALQCMLFLHIALCIESFENAVSPGRLDQILNPYYQADLEAGRITYQQARELLALFVLKLDEAILVNDGNTFLKISRLFETMSTDQTITAGGMDENGNDATNPLTYALLDICELQPYAANMTARIHPGSPDRYLERIAEVYLNGAPMPALYNDEVYVASLTKHYDTTLAQARNYAIVGCVEPNASDDHFGNTDCANMNVVLPFLQALSGDQADLWNISPLQQAHRLASKFVSYVAEGRKGLWAKAASFCEVRRTFAPVQVPGSMEELLERYQQRLNALATAILTDHQNIESVIRKDFPTPLTSALFASCMDKGLDVNDGGAALNSSGIQAVGITDVADSLHALNEVVFKQRRFTLTQVLEAMQANFQGPEHQKIRQALQDVPKFGQDEDPEAAAWVNRTLQVYVNALSQVPNPPRNGIYAAGYYALNVNDVYGKKTPALPSGRLAGMPLANSITPHYGMKANDLLSALNSVASVDFENLAPNGTTVTFTVDAALFQGPAGVRNLAGIFKTFFQNGGMQFQPNVISREMLLDAYKNPDKYPYLLVRIAGYCAYFNHLSDDLKKIIINRTCYG